MEHCSDFLTRENHRDPKRFGTGDSIQPIELPPQHVLVQEKKRAQCLVLAGGAQVSVGGEAREELRDLLLTHFVRMAFAVKENEPPDPADIGPLGSMAVMPGPDGVADPIEQPGWLGTDGAPP